MRVGTTGEGVGTAMRSAGVNNRKGFAALNVEARESPKSTWLDKKSLKRGIHTCIHVPRSIVPDETKNRASGGSHLN